MMPILKLLYNADDHNAHHIYMSLIILLILSQDENFNKSVHELVRSPSCLVYSSYFRKMGYVFIRVNLVFYILTGLVLR